MSNTSHRRARGSAATHPPKTSSRARLSPTLATTTRLLAAGSGDAAASALAVSAVSSRKTMTESKERRRGWGGAISSGRPQPTKRRIKPTSAAVRW